MAKRRNQIDVYKINTQRNNYIVALEGLKNDINGNRRFKATIIVDSDMNQWLWNAVYTFTGHHLGEKGECEWIVDHYEKEIEKDY